MTLTPSPDWIAVDWGTTNLRAFAMRQGAVVAEAVSDDGMGKLVRDAFEPALIRLIAPWLSAQHPTPVIACGMVGSRQGWFEAPYRTTPCLPIDPSALVNVPTTDTRITMRIVPGLRQDKPADVMRGEETQIAGALALTPGFDGVFCLPGTHTKWVHISAGEIVSFQTFMTGELFALLSEHSVLRHGMVGGGWDDAAFDAALSDALSRPEKIAAMLFSLRAEGLLAGLAAPQARARLSGLLIGVELAGAKPYWLGQPIALIGAERLSATYARALTAQGLAPTLLDATACTLAGLSRLHLPMPVFTSR
jgi:2-dehydro-3-deoxygalactonokinase